MSTLREVQLYGLKILKEFARICDENDLQYYLSWGTLLGAVRHGGFIPWDNDIDVSMPISDYRKFLRIAPKQLPDWLFLQTYRTDRGYNELWAKLRANGTTSMPVAWKNYSIHYGISIDIFPIVGDAATERGIKHQQTAFRLCRTLLAKEFLTAVQPEQLNNRKLRLLYMLPWRFRIYLCDILTRAVFLDIKEGCDVAMVDNELRRHYPKKAFGQGRQICFEGISFLAPLDYDRVLTKMYGDYMTPPPPEERGYGHELSLGKIIYDCDKDYRDYLKEIENP